MYKVDVIALCNAAELQEERRENIVSVIKALQNDSDRDVRHLLSHLLDITINASETHSAVCHAVASLRLLSHLLDITINASETHNVVRRAVASLRLLSHLLDITINTSETHSVVRHAVASLRLVSPVAATDGVILFFLPKKVTTFLVTASGE